MAGQPTETATATTATSANKVRVMVKIAANHLSATALVPKSGQGVAPPDASEIIKALASEKVVFGLKEDVIASLVSSGESAGFVTVASGIDPVAGEDAKIEFLFSVKNESAPLTDEKGRIDYREVSILQGVEKGAVLARKTPATAGTDGKGVDGLAVSAQNGRDFQIPIGTNTRLSENGLELTASVGGVLHFSGNTIAVRDMVSISGDVDFSVGNIHTPGSVFIAGNVPSGFKVHAGGDIEIAGSVDDAEIVAGGDVLIKGGVTGQGQAHIKAEGNVTVQYIEGQKIVAGKSVYIGGDALNAHLEAGQWVVVKAPNGRIHGGYVAAEKGIRAACLGSEIWSPTTLKVATDISAWNEFTEARKDIERLEADEKRVREGVYSLARLEMDGKLSSEKKLVLQQLRAVQKTLPENIAFLKTRIKELEVVLAEKLQAKIIATSVLHTGVCAYFGVVYFDVKQDRPATVLSCVSQRVVMDPYNPAQDPDAPPSAGPSNKRR